LKFFWSIQSQKMIRKKIKGLEVCDKVWSEIWFVGLYV
jgi:hypothetical protein